jgi:hypothetical protein
MKRGAVENWFKRFKKYFWRSVFAVLFFVVAGTLNYFVGTYADGNGTILLNDPFFRYLQALDFLGPVFVWGIFVSIGILLLYPFIFRIKDFAFTLSQFALLVMIRNAFVFLSGLRAPVDAVNVSFPGIINLWNFQNDLMFSGHVAMPLLGFFIFKDSKMRWFFLADAILMGAVALLTHLHYSIDILVGVFVAYGSYKLGEWMFGKWMRR